MSSSIKTLAKRALPYAARAGDIVLSQTAVGKANRALRQVKNAAVLYEDLVSAAKALGVDKVKLPHMFGGNPTVTPGVMGPGISSGYQYTNRPPRFNTRGQANGKVVVTHRELVASVDPVGSSWGMDSDFNGILINPGNYALFPWLATIATSYDKYVFRKLVFEYVPTCATTKEGRVILSIDVDASDSQPATYQEHMATMNAKSSTPWMPLTLAHWALPKTPKFIRNNWLLIAPHPASDFCGKLFSSNSGFTGSVGDIFVSYVVELMDPQSVIPPAVGYTQITTPSATDPMGFGAGVTTAMVGTVPVELYADGSDSFFTFPMPGVYSIDIMLRNTAAGLSSPILAGNAAGRYQMFSIASDGKTIAFKFLVYVTVARQYIKFHITGTPLTATFTVSPIPYATYNTLITNMTSF